MALCSKYNLLLGSISSSFLFIFNDSIKNEYNRILYLEDDFELKQEIDQTYFKGKNKDAREWFYVRLVK